MSRDPSPATQVGAGRTGRDTTPRPRGWPQWLRSVEGWVGTRQSAVVLFLLALAIFALQSAALPVGGGRDIGRYVQAYLQLGYDHAILAADLNARGPLAALGVGLPLELGGVAAEIWLALLYAASVVAWSVVAYAFGPRAAGLTAVLLLANPGYGILFHGLSSDALFAAGFAGWAVLLSRALLRPSTAGFLAAGAGMGALVLIRPGNQVLILLVAAPLLLRASWGRRLSWAAAFFVGSVAVTQGWRALAAWRWGDEVALRPSVPAVAVAAVALGALLAPPLRRRWLLAAGVPVALLAAAAFIVASGVRNPVELARQAAQGPSTGVFWFKVYEIDRIVGEDNGPASRQLARVVERELLPKEPYRSYRVDVSTALGSGSDRIFSDLGYLTGVDLQEVTHEAIRSHPGAFVAGVVDSLWSLLWSTRVYAPAGATVDTTPASSGEPALETTPRLPEPTEGQPIPASHYGPVITTLYGDARERWFSATDHRLVFEDGRDERRWEAFAGRVRELTGRIPTRDGSPGLVHRLNQASRGFPPPIVWLVLGAVALALRRPRRAIVAIAPATGAAAVILMTALVAFPVAQYAAPVAPAFVLLAAAGLLGVEPRGRLRRPRRG